MTPPGQESIDKGNKGDDAEQRGNDGSTNLDTKPSTIGKSVKGILSLVLVIVGDNNATSSKGLLSLGISQLGNGQRGGDGHDAGRHQGLSIQSQRDVTDEN